jgi:tRNA A37 threonylcarbamoyladenosine modification protein TsaB
LIDARKGEVYLGCYRFANGEMIELVQPCLRPVSALASLLAPFADKVFVGSGAECHGDLLKSAFTESRLLYRSNFLASEIGKIALQRFRRRQFVTDLQKMLPFYIRRPDAKSNPLKPDGAVD